MKYKIVSWASIFKSLWYGREGNITIYLKSRQGFVDCRKLAALKALNNKNYKTDSSQ